MAEFQPEQIWFFGSQVWGTPGPDSDLDLIVIVPDTDEAPARRMRRALRCLRGVGVAKDVLVQTRKEFERYRDVRASLAYKVLHEGESPGETK